MSEPEGGTEGDQPHNAAAREFVRRVRDRDIEALERLILFGSTARDEAGGLGSDVDFFAVVSDDAEKPAVEDELRDVAYDVMIDHGPVVEVHVVTRSTFERRRDHPFVRRVRRGGRVYV